PWNEPVTAPNASTCTVVVAWESAHVKYPALVDPNWTTADSMSVARYYHTSSVKGGRVLVAGGLTSTGATDSVEIYEPITGTWAAAGSMGTKRYLHTATVLSSGSVLF